VCSAVSRKRYEKSGTANIVVVVDDEARRKRRRHDTRRLDGDTGEDQFPRQARARPRVSLDDSGAIEGARPHAHGPESTAKLGTAFTVSIDLIEEPRRDQRIRTARRRFGRGDRPPLPAPTISQGPATIFPLTALPGGVLRQRGSHRSCGRSGHARGALPRPCTLRGHG